MKKPKAIRSGQIFYGRYWLDLQKNGDLIIMPRMHHSSNRGLSAGINITHFQPLQMQISIHEDKVPSRKPIIHCWSDSKRIGAYPPTFCGYKYHFGAKSGATPHPKDVTCKNCLRKMVAEGIKI